ncbi:protoporphyrinogen oxidase [Cellulomonas carbonis T26]|uniref:Coproporphyrinogen III oxidase n=1 Tax=Cellulomonas carbonis T26 TaxID=947969 RepID=A0A0A0BXF1_9CELL|nr:protoporphyrinogen oxidase [Cellulomonas carbonis T26]
MVGGGLSGLVAARTLARTGTSVVLLERDDRVGGQVRSEPFGGAVVDVGAESLHRGAPRVAALLDELGLGTTLVGAAPGSARLWSRGRLRPLPAGVGPTGPTRLWPVVRSGVLSPVGLLRAGLEPVRARRRVDGDVSVGAFLEHRFGREVVDRFVDPLLGTLHGADVRRLSLAATAPQLLPAAREGRSLVVARRSRGAGGPGFATWTGGMATLADAVLSGTSVEVRTSTVVEEVRRGADGGLVVATSCGPLDAAAVVLATPAGPAADVVRGLAPDAAALLDGVRAASVVTVLARLPHGSLPEGTTGVLVPSSAGRLLKAVTVLSAKWPHLAGGDVLVRLSAGRAGEDDVCALPDDVLLARLLADLAAVTGVPAEPTETLVHRWPAALPQLEVGHVERVVAARAALAPHDVVLAGASYDGLGLAACVRSGLAAAERLADRTAVPAGASS